MKLIISISVALSIVTSHNLNANEKNTGESLYKANCSVCHGNGRTNSIGPAIIYSRQVHTPETMANRIRLGGNIMPPFEHLGDDAITRITDFVFNGIDTATFAPTITTDTPLGISTSTEPARINEGQQKGDKWVSQFGYSSTNNAVSPSLIGPENLDKLTLESHPKLHKALKYMPLMSRQGGTNDRILYYGTNDHAIEAYNIDTKKIRWRTELLDRWQETEIDIPSLVSTPAIDQETDRLFAFTYGFEKNGQAYRPHFSHFNIIDLNSGEKQVSCPVNTAKMLGAETKIANNWKQHSHCKTAVAMTKTGAKTSLYVGCSLVILNKSDFFYDNKAKVRGSILKLESDENGSFKDCNMSMQPTSKIIDTGIYNAGSKLTTLKNGDLLATTGNGPVDINQGNLGCAFVRLKSDLTIRKSALGQLQGYSPYPENDKECWLLNDEYTVASTSVVDLGDTQIASALTKGGLLSFYNVDNFDVSGSHVKNIQLGKAPSYGTPAGFAVNNHAVFIAAVRGNDSTDVDSFYAKEDYSVPSIDHTLMNEHERSANDQSYCYGYLSSEKKKQAVNRYFSGKKRNDSAILLSTDTYVDQITQQYSSVFGSKANYYYSKHLWAPYKYTQTLGYSVNKDFAETIIKLKPELNLSIDESLPVLLDGYNRDFDAHRTQKGFQFLRIEEGLKECPDLGHKLTPIYFTKRDVRGPIIVKNDSIVAFSVSKDLSVDILWIKPLEKNTELTVTHPLLIDSGKDKLALISVINKNAGIKPQLLFIDVNNGHELKRINTPSAAHFSMPLAFDEKLVLPTTNGTYVLGLQTINSQQ